MSRASGVEIAIITEALSTAPKAFYPHTCDICRRLCAGQCSPGQSIAAQERRVPGVEFEILRRPVVSVEQRHLVRKLGLVMPKLDRPDIVVGVAAAQQPHHGFDAGAGKERNGDGAG